MEPCKVCGVETEVCKNCGGCRAHCTCSERVERHGKEVPEKTKPETASAKFE